MVGYNESSGQSQSDSSSRPTNPKELAAYFQGIDTLTGGSQTTSKVPVLTKRGTQKTDLQGNPLYKKVTTTTPGRLSTWAQQGTPQVAYNADTSQVNYSPISRDVSYQDLTPAQLQALGGAGATREMQANRSYQSTADQIAADPRMSVFQAERGRQLAGRDLADAMDAISKETEASITNLAQKQHEMDYQAGTENRSFAADQAAKAYDAAQRNRDYLAAERGRAYDASVRNADLTKEDMLALAQLYFGGKGTYSKSSSSSSSSSAGGNLL